MQQVRDATDEVLLVLVHDGVGLRDAPQLLDQLQLLVVSEFAVHGRGELVQVVRPIHLALGVGQQFGTLRGIESEHAAHRLEHLPPLVLGDVVVGPQHLDQQRRHCEVARLFAPRRAFGRGVPEILLDPALEVAHSAAPVSNPAGNARHQRCCHRARWLPTRRTHD